MKTKTAFLALAFITTFIALLAGLVSLQIVSPVEALITLLALTAGVALEIFRPINTSLYFVVIAISLTWTFIAALNGYWLVFALAVTFTVKYVSIVREREEAETDRFSAPDDIPPSVTLRIRTERTEYVYVQKLARPILPDRTDPNWS